MKRFLSNQGFSFIEFLVVIFIIGIFSLPIFLTFKDSDEDSKDKQQAIALTKVRLQEFAKACASYQNQFQTETEKQSSVYKNRYGYRQKPLKQIRDKVYQDTKVACQEDKTRSKQLVKECGNKYQKAFALKIDSIRTVKGAAYKQDVVSAYQDLKAICLVS